MQTCSINKWHDVWSRKGCEASGCDLENLMRADGFDAGTGCISVDDWWRVSGHIQNALNIQPDSHILEVGCGAGAMLYTLLGTNAKLFGVDYSSTLVEHAEKALPTVSVQESEAASLPFSSNSLDGAFSHGVFFYFPDLDYARKSLQELLRVVRPGGSIFVLDVPDEATMAACETYRRDVVYAGESYPTGQDSPYRHLYYPRSFFVDFAQEHGLTVQTNDQSLESYPMSPYRFNALLRKPGKKS